MLIINRLEMEDFGPFRGNQTLEFPVEGVSIIYGENMDGKTSLLNAFRFVLYGQALSRLSHVIPISELGNWEAKSEDHKYDFKVKLTFSLDGDSYELTRSCSPRRVASIPHYDEDFTIKHSLRRNGESLGPEETEVVLSKALPEGVSRFFLFDGELLSQYEELMHRDSQIGPKISESIERILGVPILIHARDDCQKLFEEAKQAEAKAASKKRETERIGNNLNELSETFKHQKSERDRYATDLKALSDEKASKEAVLKRNEKTKNLIDERRHLESENKAITEQIPELHEKVAILMQDAWRTLLGPKIAEVKLNVETRAGPIKERILERTIQEEVSKIIEKAVKEGKCPVCTQEMASDLREKLKDRIVPTKVKGGADEIELSKLNGIIARLEDLRGMDILKDLRRLCSDVDQLKVKRSENDTRIREIRDEVGEDVDEERLKTLFEEFERLVEQITITEKGLEDMKAEIKKTEERIKWNQDKLEAIGGISTRETERRKTYDSLFKLYGGSVAEYRDALRKKVEGDASDLFVKLIKSKGYARLLINDNYGLRIVHVDGTEIPVRSAGAEHIVALSLIGALQKNAPLRGPIIMDSALFRLDREHKTNLLKALPGMTEQAILLVIKDELPPILAHENLEGSLRMEKVLVKKTDKHTTFRDYLGAE